MSFDSCSHAHLVGRDLVMIVIIVSVVQPPRFNILFRFFSHCMVHI